jgi:hypothetical protein
MDKHIRHRSWNGHPSRCSAQTYEDAIPRVCGTVNVPSNEYIIGEPNAQTKELAPG